MNKVNGQTPYRQELRMRILKAAMNEFFEKGIKAVKMDDIAQQLSISKRTLYEIYSNKEELLLEGMKSAERGFDEYQIVIKLARESFHYAMMNQLYKEYTMQVVFRNTILLFIRGICTPKGIDMLEHIK